YAITAGAVTAATVTVDKASYVSGGDMKVTVTLKDAQNNAVSGQASALKGAVKVAGAATAPKVDWAEAGSGSYTATFTATTAGTGLTARLTLGGASANSTAYAITAGAVTAATVTVDKASYVSGGD
ncbi:invasin domain 3-containing protein, partial [Enterobacter sp. 200527-13]|uniref:invasin domain 3-containing protein n=1 Tax=Enterobacter sp. 200527-13 TaxID=2995131 RepID=UPI00248F92A8